MFTFYTLRCFTGCEWNLLIHLLKKAFLCSSFSPRTVRSSKNLWFSNMCFTIGISWQKLLFWRIVNSITGSLLMAWKFSGYWCTFLYHLEKMLGISTWFFFILALLCWIFLVSISKNSKNQSLLHKLHLPTLSVQQIVCCKIKAWKSLFLHKFWVFSRKSCGIFVVYPWSKMWGWTPL